MSKMLVYLSGPYSAPTREGVEANIQAARKIATQLWEEGYAVITPHLNTAHFGDDCKATYEDYIEADLLMVERSDAVVMMPHWQRSQGANREHDHAWENGVRVAYWPERPAHLGNVEQIKPMSSLQTPEGQALGLAYAVDRYKDAQKAIRPGVHPAFRLSDFGERLAQEQSDRVRTFKTGATRDTDEGKLKYEGFFSPAVLRRRAEYMHKHRVQADGSLRDPDNWQKGIDRDVYMDSLVRHVADLWYAWRDKGLDLEGIIEELTCAIMFNAEGLLFETLREKRNRPKLTSNIWSVPERKEPIPHA